MDKLLTIIIPTYNMEKYLDKCLASLILPDSQLMKQIEVLVIIDGATDSSSAIAHRYEADFFDIFRVINKKNGNYGSCVNRGLKEAKGKYIKVLDADDYFDTEIFKEYLELLSNTNADAILNGFDMVTKDGSIKTSIRYQLPENEILPFSRILDVADKMWMHSVTYKTERLRMIRYKQTEGVFYSDQEWIFLPMTTVRTFVYFNKPLYKYLTGREGQSVNSDVWEQNFWMEMKGEMVMLEEYQQLSDISHIAKEYLLSRLVVRARTIYVAYLFKFKTLVNKKQMIEFDVTLKNRYPNIYNRIVKADRCILREITPLSICLFHIRLPRSIIRFISAIIAFTLYRMSLLKHFIVRNHV